MGSVRARLTLIAALSTALAVVALAVVLSLVLRGRLEAEVEDAAVDQAVDYASSVFFVDDIGFERLSVDVGTLAVVIDGAGQLLDTNDSGVTADELRDQLDLTPLEVDAYAVGDLSLVTPTETTGAGNLRYAQLQLQLEDRGEEPVFVVVARSLDGVNTAMRSVRNGLLIGLPLLVAFVAGLAWWLTGRSLRPVDVLRSEVDEIGATDLSRRVSEPARGDEVSRLAETMNGLLERVDHASTRQQRFVSDAAHELRTPLASMGAQLDVAATHPTSSETPALIGSLRSDVTRLQQLVDGLLFLARADADAGSAGRRDLVDLDDVALEVSAAVVRPDGVALDLAGIGAAPCRGDVNALTRLVENLLANAVRHAQSRVAVATGFDSGSSWLVVDDDGSGVDPPDRERVFERFVRLDEARNRDAGGSGLGLALSREIAHAHGGSLVVDTSPLGGARFIFRLSTA